MILDWVLGLPEDDIEVQTAVFGPDGDERA